MSMNYDFGTDEELLDVLQDELDNQIRARISRWDWTEYINPIVVATTSRGEDYDTVDIIPYLPAYTNKLDDYIELCNPWDYVYGCGMIMLAGNLLSDTPINEIHISGLHTDGVARAFPRGLFLIRTSGGEVVEAWQSRADVLDSDTPMFEVLWLGRDKTNE